MSDNYRQSESSARYDYQKIQEQLTGLNRKLNRRKAPPLTPQIFSEIISGATNTAINTVGVPGAEAVLEVSHRILETLFRKWMDPKTTLDYLDQLSAARRETTFPEVKKEIGVILSILDKVQSSADRPEREPKKAKRGTELAN